MFLSRLSSIGTESKEASHHSSLRGRASILVPLFFEDDGSVSVLLTQRAVTLKSHSGDVCFPGGKQDPDDKNDDIETALREQNEEIGLEKSLVEILCRLPTMESLNHLCVTPVVGLLHLPKGTPLERDNNSLQQQPQKHQKQQEKQQSSESPSSSSRLFSQLRLCKDEVEVAFVVPLSFFITEPHSKYDVEWSGETFAMRTYYYTTSVYCAADYDNESKKKEERTFKIYGLTAHIANQVAEIAFGDRIHSDNNIDNRNGKDSEKDDTSNNNDEEEQEPHLEISGYLWKLQESKVTNKTFWRRYFFVIDVNTNNDIKKGQQQQQHFLHQYDNEQQANLKSMTATKKNRLPLRDCKVTVMDNIATTSQRQQLLDSHHQDGQKKEFIISILDDRIQWHLAASTEQERQRWINFIHAISYKVSASSQM